MCTFCLALFATMSSTTELIITLESFIPRKKNSLYKALCPPNTTMNRLNDDCILHMLRFVGARKLGSTSKRMRALVVRYVDDHLAMYPRFGALMRNPMRDLFRLQELKLSYEFTRVYTESNFELFCVAGNNTHSFLFPCTLNCMLVLSSDKQLHFVILFNAPQYQSFNDTVCNQHYVVHVGMNLDVLILDLETRVWTVTQLPYERYRYVQTFFVSNNRIVVIVWYMNAVVYYTVDLGNGSFQDEELLDTPIAPIMMHHGNMLVGFGEDEDLGIPKKTEVQWIKRFESSEKRWMTVLCPPRICTGYLQFAQIGDFALFFMERCRKIACLHNGKWLTDIELLFLAQPWWTSWHTTCRGLVSWDVWSNRIDVHEYRFF